MLKSNEPDKQMESNDDLHAAGTWFELVEILSVIVFLLVFEFVLEYGFGVHLLDPYGW